MQEEPKAYGDTGRRSFLQEELKAGGATGRKKYSQEEPHAGGAKGGFKGMRSHRQENPQEVEQQA